LSEFNTKRRRGCINQGGPIHSCTHRSQQMLCQNNLNRVPLRRIRVKDSNLSSTRKHPIVPGSGQDPS
jgi:hypothetical protein